MNELSHSFRLFKHLSISQLKAISQHSSSDANDSSQLSKDAAILDEHNDPSNAYVAKYLSETDSFDFSFCSDCSTDCISSTNSDGSSANIVEDLRFLDEATPCDVERPIGTVTLVANEVEAVIDV